jgi:uncharacterized membrane protein YedE/YeeE
MRIMLGLVFGAIFGLGIALSGMINPAKVLNFFDIAGSWDPSLAFVMAGGLAVSMPGYFLIFRNRKAPLLSNQFHLPKARIIDIRLVGGAAVFGIGWGIAGFCPGGAIPALGLLDLDTVIFLAAMVGGMLIARAIGNLRMERLAKA